MPENPKCINPQCGRRKTVRVISPGEYVCSHCGTEFDDHPDEGGDYHADLSKRMERAEGRKGKR